MSNVTHLTPASTSATPVWFILADDLTGAADTASAFRRHGYRTLLQLTPQPAGGEWQVVSVDANVRESPEDAEEVLERVRSTLSFEVSRPRYLKIDSTLRGPVRTFVEEGRGVLPLFICPAFPAQGRVTQGGVQFAHGHPVEVVTRNGERVSRLQEIFHTSDAVIANAESEAELDEWAARVYGEEFCFVGSAGLAAALARCRPMNDPPPRLPEVERVVVLAGSAHPKTHAQLDALGRHRSYDKVHIHQAPRDSSGSLHEGVAQQLVEEALSLPLPSPSMGYVLTGGATARCLLEAAEVSTLEVGGEVSPGIPWLIARDGRVAGSPIVTKSGGFGGEDALTVAAEFLLSGTG